jgi:hypothetical protein
MTGVGDAIGRIFQGLLELIEPFVIPDWGGLIDLLPVLLLLGVVGPIVTLLVLGWFIYFVARPRDRIPYVEPAPTPAPLVDGVPAYPRGEPYCAIDLLVLPIGTTQCPRCRREATVECPKCGIARPAFIETCANCGLVLRIEPRAVTVARVAPPPGGAAAA